MATRECLPATSASISGVRRSSHERSKPAELIGARSPSCQRMATDSTFTRKWATLIGPRSARSLGGEHVLPLSIPRFCISNACLRAQDAHVKPPFAGLAVHAKTRGTAISATETAILKFLAFCLESRTIPARSTAARQAHVCPVHGYRRRRTNTWSD
jgi:hypothetical protein